MWSLEKLKEWAEPALRYKELIVIARSAPSAKQAKNQALEFARNQGLGEEVAKACRWLIIIRRDYGQKAQEEYISSAREVTPQETQESKPEERKMTERLKKAMVDVSDFDDEHLSMIAERLLSKLGAYNDQGEMKNELPCERFQTELRFDDISLGVYPHQCISFWQLFIKSGSDFCLDFEFNYKSHPDRLGQDIFENECSLRGCNLLLQSDGHTIVIKYRAFSRIEAFKKLSDFLYGIAYEIRKKHHHENKKRELLIEESEKWKGFAQKRTGKAKQEEMLAQERPVIQEVLSSLN